MYLEHATAIQQYAQRSADNLEHVGQFVAFTIHTHLDLSVQRTLDFRNGDYNVIDNETLYSTRWVISWLGAHKETLHWHLQDIYNSDHSDTDKANYMLSYIAGEVPGLDLIKAGFLIQLSYGLSGCLDTHNLSRFKLNKSTFDRLKRLKTIKARKRKVSNYNATCERFGGTSGLWDNWCEYLADKYVKYANAHEVSRLHCVALNLEGNM